MIGYGLSHEDLPKFRQHNKWINREMQWKSYFEPGIGYKKLTTSADWT